MKPSRVTEEQIIAILREQEAGAATADVSRKHGILERHVLQMEGQVWRSGGFRRQAAEDAGGREREAQEAVGRGDARQRHAQGCRIKKMVTPAARREAVARLRSSFEVSERRACAALGVDRTSVRYHGDRPDDAAVRARMRELAAKLLEPLLGKNFLLKSYDVRAVAGTWYAAIALFDIEISDLRSCAMRSRSPAASALASATAALTAS
jgi:hypothetical protein